jgi:hypothetical protein
VLGIDGVLRRKNFEPVFFERVSAGVKKKDEGGIRLLQDGSRPADSARHG